MFLVPVVVTLELESCMLPTLPLENKELMFWVWAKLSAVGVLTSICTAAEPYTIDSTAMVLMSWFTVSETVLRSE